MVAAMMRDDLEEENYEKKGSVHNILSCINGSNDGGFGGVWQQ
jgi:hypothetical protein